MKKYDIEIYPKNLMKSIKNTKYIPRRIGKKERLVCFHRFWIGSVDAVYKLSNIEDIGNIHYYFFENKSTTQIYTYPISDNDFYELTINTDDLLSKDIIDNKTKYKGYEIRYWFYKNWDNKYKDFKKYLDLRSRSLIDDNSTYIVQAMIINGEYRNCKLILP